MIFGFLVVAKLGVAFVEYQSVGRGGVWVMVIFFILGIVTNWITPSRKERMVMLPVNIGTLVCSLTVALAEV